jgi:hypothetical protein
MLAIDIDVGRRRAVRRPCVGDRSLYIYLLEVHVENVNLRPGGALIGNKGPFVGKGGESDVESRDLQGCSPHPCQLLTDGLTPVSKY